MHEMSYVVRFVNQALTVANERHASRVTGLVLDIGEMTGIEDDYLRRYYTTAAKGTLLENSTLEIHHVPITAKCDTCGLTYHPSKEHDYLCPDCHSGICHITRGRGAVLRQVKLLTDD